MVMEKKQNKGGETKTGRDKKDDAKTKIKKRRRTAGKEERKKVRYRSGEKKDEVGGKKRRLW